LFYSSPLVLSYQSLERRISVGAVCDATDQKKPPGESEVGFKARKDTQSRTQAFRDQFRTPTQPLERAKEKSRLRGTLGQSSITIRILILSIKLRKEPLGLVFEREGVGQK
jgi:hypothetical protein